MSLFEDFGLNKKIIKHSIQCWHCGKFRKRSEVEITTDWETPQYADDIICVYCIEKRRKKNEKKI